MASLTAKISQMISDRILEGSSPTQQTQSGEAVLPATPEQGFAVPDLSLDFSFEDTAFLDSTGSALDFEQFLGGCEPTVSATSPLAESPMKRKYSAQDSGLSEWKRFKSESTLSDTANLFFPDCGVAFQIPEVAVPSPSELAAADQSSGSEDSGWDKFRHPNSVRAGSEESVGRAISPASDLNSELDQSAEYHFELVQKHAQLAIAALRRGQYEHNRNIVTWAHELKNKTANEIKKEAEQAWEADKDKDRLAAPKAALKKNANGSTKRVEQFRKNMRRWMIGTQVHQIGVEWMVYARMEHLLAISKFILGEALPVDPASPSAVAESICKHLDCKLSTEFIDGQLAEPEPGKRYAIGQALVPHLQAKLPRKVPSLAFTMPADGNTTALAEWLAQLRALFPKKPAPKARTTVNKA